jgi:hypothetical protein
MTAIAITPSADPAQTVAYCTLRDGQGNVVSGGTLWFRLRAPNADQDAWSRYNFTATSAANGLVQVAVTKGADYQVRGNKGEWIDFTAGDEDTTELPQIVSGDGS